MVSIPMMHQTAEPIPDYVLWMWLQDALGFVEAHFGPRGTAWELGPLRVVPDGPHTFFPAVGRPIVEVHLGPYALRYAPTAFFQLAHESVHLLTPRWGERASLLEEGLATWASIAYTHVRSPWHPMRPHQLPRYAEALALVEALLGPPEHGGDPCEIGAAVRALRARVGAISEATADDLQAVWPTMDRATAEQLAAPAGEMRP